MRREKFSNINYRPEEWNAASTELNSNLTGIPVIDAADKLSQKVVIDEQTSCLNRSYYENLKSRFDAQRTKNNEIAIIFIDLNGLKNINDTFGHEAGDEVIRTLACFLKAKFRTSDEVIRWGGDEFVIICHNHNSDAQFESNLQNKVETAQKEFEKQLAANQMPSNGFAVGVAVFNQNADTSLDNILERADAEMYKNKSLMKSNSQI